MSSLTSFSIDKPKEIGLKHLFDSKVINLGVGAPGPDLLKNCCEIFKKATEHRMDIEYKTNTPIFQYGTGTAEVRSILTKFLSQKYGDNVSQNDLLITAGASYGLYLILSTLIDMNGIIFVDEVTYMIALEVFGQFTNMKIVPVKLDNDGTNLNNLRNLLQKHKFDSKNKLFWAMYYTIPTYHNPTGILFSEEKCKNLIKLAREFDILIVCDDVYNMLHYNVEKSPKRLFAYDNVNDIDYRGNVISNGTFSKIIAPGIRLGWLECSKRCMNVFNLYGSIYIGGCTNNYTSGVVASMIQLGLAQSHVSTMVQHYKNRMIAICEALKQDLPNECSFIEPGGGYFVWIRLPETINAKEFCKFCIEKYKIFLIPGSRFSIEEKFKNYLRISIAFHSESVLQEAAKRLCDALKDYILKINQQIKKQK